MAHRGDLLDLLEAREAANYELKAQDAKILAIDEARQALIVERELLWTTWRLVNTELGQATAEVFPAPGVRVQVDAPIDFNADAVRRAMIDSERADMSEHYGEDEDREPMEGNEVPEPWDG